MHLTFDLIHWYWHYQGPNCYKYRITSVLKLRHIITSIAASLTERAVILMIMYVKIFKTGILVFIGDVKMCLTSHWHIIFNIRVSSSPCELRTDIIFLWIKVSSVIRTLSAALIKWKMSNLQMMKMIGQCDVKHIMTSQIKTTCTITSVLKVFTCNMRQATCLKDEVLKFQ